MFYGVERPFVDTVIIPTTWFEVGAGVHGEIGRGWRYRAYVMAPLNAASSAPKRASATGRQKGSETNIGRAGGDRAPRVRRLRGLTAGASFWSGRRASSSARGSTCRSRSREADVRYAPRSPRAARPSSRRSQSPTPPSSTTRSAAQPASIRTSRSSLRGFYGEAGYRVDLGRARSAMSASSPDTRTSTRSTACRQAICLSRSSIATRGSIGGTYWPDPDIAVKVDYIDHAQARAS